MVSSGRPAWWRGERGEWYVAVQVALIVLVFFGPRHTALLPPWPSSMAAVARVTGPAMMIGGALLFLIALVHLWPQVTPLPYPKEGGVLRQTGPYRIVRHPIYAGGLALAFGWALVVHGWLTLGYAVALLVFMDLKATREEKWLVARYPAYGEYQRRVRKLIPLIR